MVPLDEGIKKKISSWDGEIELEAWDSERKILLISLVKEQPVESLSIKFKDKKEIINFADFLSKHKNAKRYQVEKFRKMVNG